MTRPRAIVDGVPAVSESSVLRACLDVCHAHPAVAWAARMNVGGRNFGSDANPRWVKFGFVGMSDIVGQLVGGRLLAIECKGHRGRATNAQLEFLRRVNTNGGVGVLVHSPDDLLAALEMRGGA